MWSMVYNLYGFVEPLFVFEKKSVTILACRLILRALPNIYQHIQVNLTKSLFLLIRFMISFVILCLGLFLYHLYTEDSEVTRAYYLFITRAYYLFKELEAMKTVSDLPQFPTLIGYVDSFPYHSVIMEYLMADTCAPTPITLAQVLKYPELTESQIIKVNSGRAVCKCILLHV